MTISAIIESFRRRIEWEMIDAFLAGENLAVSHFETVRRGDGFHVEGQFRRLPAGVKTAPGPGKWTVYDCTSAEAVATVAAWKTTPDYLRWREAHPPLGKALMGKP